MTELLPTYLSNDVLLVPPVIERDGDHILCSEDEASRDSRKRVKKTLLGDFTNLSDASDEAIVAFAQRWGLLGLCNHGLPAGHNQMPRLIAPEVYFSLRHALFCIPERRESITAWRSYAGYFRTVTDIAARLHSGSHADEEQWEALRPTEMSRRDWRSYYGNTMTMQKRALVSVVNACADVAGLVPALSWWTKAKPELHIGGRFSSTLFVVLTVQLLLAVSQSEMATCSYCRSVYLPQRKPKAGQKNYCPRCREANIPVILALREARVRSKGGSNGKTRSK